MAGQCRKSPFCACAACALDRQGEYLMPAFQCSGAVIEVAELSHPNRSNIKVVGGSTKQCTMCGCTDFVLLRSLNIKSCADCKAEIHWPLTKGQKPLL